MAQIHKAHRQPKIKESRVYKCTEITDPSTGLKVARGYAPSDYTVSGETIWCGQWQSLNYAAQVYLTAMSPDQNTIMGYYSPVGYEQILEYSQNSTDYSWHQDGSFDSTTMMPMLQFMTADTYCDYMAKAILPGQQLQIAGQDEISQEEQAILDQKANTNYQETCQMLSQLNTGITYNVDGAYCGVAKRTYSVSLNGYPFKLYVISLVEATQLPRQANLRTWAAPLNQAALPGIHRLHSSCSPRRKNMKPIRKYMSSL